MITTIILNLTIILKKRYGIGSFTGIICFAFCLLLVGHRLESALKLSYISGYDKKNAEKNLRNVYLNHSITPTIGKKK